MEQWRNSNSTWYHGDCFTIVVFYVSVLLKTFSKASWSEVLHVVRTDLCEPCFDHVLYCSMEKHKARNGHKVVETSQWEIMKNVKSNQRANRKKQFYWLKGQNRSKFPHYCAALIRAYSKCVMAFTGSWSQLVLKFFFHV